MRGSGVFVYATMILAVLLAGNAGAQTPHLAPLAALREPGATLFLRPMESDWLGEAEAGQGCKDSAPLTEAGRNEARALGLALGALKLRIDVVESSALCRALETARLVAGEPRIKGALGAVQGVPLSAQRSAIEATVRSPGEGLRIVVGGYEIMQSWLGQTLGEGEGLVLKPEGGQIKVLARLRPGDWRAVTPTAGAGARRF